MNNLVIAVSLKDVIMGGVFGPIALGMPRTQIQAELGTPDDWSVIDAARRGTEPWRTSAIWKYGDVEFHYGLLDDDCLALIFMDDFTVPRGGRSIALDPWIIQRTVSQTEVERALHAAHIEFRRIESRYDEEVTGLAVGTSVRLWWAREGPKAQPLLYSFVCADPRLPGIEK